MMSSFEQLLCDLGLATPNAAAAGPVNGPVFGAREDEMGIAFGLFKTPAKQRCQAIRRKHRPHRPS
ncbi:hypothetical protein ASD31_18155 [Rhizobium sp. Root482]|jgi:hypothetical protein|nr:hypothetical protein ASD31_18155 [Rhizobium sp. Root482]